MELSNKGGSIYLPRIIIHKHPSLSSVPLLSLFLSLQPAFFFFASSFSEGRHLCYKSRHHSSLALCSGDFPCTLFFLSLPPNLTAVIKQGDYLPSRTDNSGTGDKYQIGFSWQGKSLQAEAAPDAAVACKEAKFLAQVWINPPSCHAIKFTIYQSIFQL